MISSTEAFNRIRDKVIRYGPKVGTDVELAERSQVSLASLAFLQTGVGVKPTKDEVKRVMDVLNLNGQATKRYIDILLMIAYSSEETTVPSSVED